MRGALRTRILVSAAGLALLAIIFFASWPFAARAGLTVVAEAMGFRLTTGGMALSPHHATLERLEMRTPAGEPVLSADRLDVEYRLRDLFPGGRRMFGLVSVDVRRPRLAILHRRDGTWNIPIPSQNAARTATGPPLNADVTVVDGLIDITDQTRIYPDARHFVIEGLNVTAHLHPAVPSHYDASATLVEAGARAPIRGRGTLDDVRGYERQHWTVERVAVAPLVNYAVNSSTLHVLGGVLPRVDATVVGLTDADGTMHRRLLARAQLRDGRLLLGGLAAPITRAHGAWHVTEQTVLTSDLRASLAGVPLRIAGGVYDLTHPKLQFGVRGTGRVASLLGVAPSARLPVRGRVDLLLHVEGDSIRPLTIAAVSGYDIRYAALPIDAFSARVALSGIDATVLAARGTYAGITASARGTVVLARQPEPSIVATLDAPPGRVPFADALVADLPLRGVALIDGVGSALNGRGIVTGTTSAAQMAATFNVDGAGRGELGPLSVDFRDGRFLYVRAYLRGQRDRPAGSGDVVVAAHGLVLHGAPPPALPGLRLPAIPAISGVLDAAVAGEFTRSGPAFGAGRLDARSAQYGGLQVAAAHLAGAGSRGVLGISRASASGAWGRFDGSGTASAATTALSGRFQGNLAAVGDALGQRGLSGSGDVPVRVFRGSHGLVAQIESARFSGASVNGVPVASLAGTFGLSGRTVDVYAASAEAAGGRIVATGSFGNGGSLAVSTSDLPLAALHANSPVQGGTVTAVASIAGTAQAPVAHGSVVLQDAFMRGLPLGASTGLDFGEGRLALHDASAVAAGAVVAADGTVAGVAGGVPRYDLNATVRGADVATLVHASGQHVSVPLEGGADADLAVRGSGAHPTVGGRVSVGSGSVNGLAFHDLGAAVSANPAGARITSAAMTVGATRVTADGAVGPSARSLRVRAMHADLSDFNDFFDEADVLGGHGSIDVALTQSADIVATRGNVTIDQARYRRFAFGNATADWRTFGRTISGRASVRGRAGTLALTAAAMVPSHDPLRDPLDRLPVDVRAAASGVDLGTWLPAAGLAAPIVGRVDARAAVHGTLRSGSATTTAELRDGFVGHVAVQHATLAAQAQHGRVRVSSAVLQIPSLAVAANGSFGLRPADPIDVSAEASSPDLGALAHVVTGKTFDAAGALQSHVRVAGSLRRPSVQDTLDVTNARYSTLSVPRVHAAVALRAGFASLDQAEVGLRRGSVRASLRVPFDVQHPRLPANAPISGWLQVAKVDLADFSPLLPKGTALKGLLDGQLQVAGTTRAPATSGAIALTNGYYASPLLRSPLTDVVARLELANSTVRLQAVHANVGRGSIDGSAVASLGDLRDPAQTLALQMLMQAKNAQIDAPKYIRGTVDGTLNVTRAANASFAVSGKIAIPTARIPMSALYNPTPQKSPSAAPPPVAFNLDVDVGRDVRIQSGQVDVGGQGSVHVGGTLAAPTLAGIIRSTGGSVDFYRNFQLESGVVRFDPKDGLMPSVYAVATTRVPEPETYVTLTVRGLAPDNLNVDLASNPSYERSQILGLLLGAQQLGAVGGVATSSGGGAPNAGQLAQSFATGALAQQFTRQILEPLSAQLGQGLGLSQLAINYDPSGGFGANARKGLGRNLTAVYAQTFNYPARQSFGLESHPGPGTSVQLTFFQQQGTGQFSPQIYSTSTNPGLTASQPAAGTSGFSFVVQRRFWGGHTKPPPSPLPSPSPETAAR